MAPTLVLAFEVLVVSEKVKDVGELHSDMALIQSLSNPLLLHNNNTSWTRLISIVSALFLPHPSSIVPYALRAAQREQNDQNRSVL